MQKDINLIYVTQKITYNGVIPRAAFLNEMAHLAIWFPDCNYNALKLKELIPEFTSININKDIIETQDVPFIVYTTADTTEPQILKLHRPYTIIWEFFIKYCNEAVKNNNKNKWCIFRKKPIKEKSLIGFWYNSPNFLLYKINPPVVLRDFLFMFYNYFYLLFHQVFYRNLYFHRTIQFSYLLMFPFYLY